MTTTRLTRLVMAAAAVALAITLLAVTGWPDPGRSLDLLTGTAVNGRTEAAFVVLGCLVMLVAAVVLTTRGPRRERGRHRALALFAAALLLLALGVARQMTSGYQVCCASGGTAQQVQSLVH